MSRDSEQLFRDIDSYLRSNQPATANKALENTLPQEVTCSKAIACAHLENELSDLLRNITRAKISDPTGLYIWREDLGKKAKKMGICLLGNQTVPLPVESVRFHSSDFSPKQDHPLFLLPKKLGVNSPDLLLLGIHMDDTTGKQVKELLEKGQILPSSLITLYLFDGLGRFAKISVFPRTVIDEREDVGIQDAAVKHVVSTMTTKDFIFAFQALTLLQEKVKKYNA